MIRVRLSLSDRSQKYIFNKETHKYFTSNKISVKIKSVIIKKAWIAVGILARYINDGAANFNKQGDRQVYLERHQIEF